MSCRAGAFRLLTRPSGHLLVLSTAIDLTRSKTQRLTENALLRQQLVILHRQIPKPTFTPADRLGLVLLSSRIGNWRGALLILKPATLLRWHRQGCRLFWKFKSRHHGGRPGLSPNQLAWIQQIAKENLLGGAEHIRGELLQLDIYVANATIQKYMRVARPPRPSSQTASVFLNNHATDVWACDFWPVTDLFFRPNFVFFVIELASRRVVPFGVTRHPSEA